MPLVRITLKQGRSPEQLRTIGEEIYQAMRETINIPENDRFQAILEQASNNLIADPDYMGIKRTGDPLFIEITFRRGRTVEAKQALFRQIAERLAAKAGIRKEDILVVLTENGEADWSFGMGEAQYVK